MKTKGLRKSIRFMLYTCPAAIKSKFYPYPIMAYLYVTRKCNLHCSYCYLRDNTKNELGTADMKKVLDHMYYLGVRWVGFMGGEPTIRKDFPELVEYACAKKMFTHVSTNGVLLNEEYIERLGTAGMDLINLSIDSVFEFDKSGKDYSRSKHVLNDLMKAREKHGFEINVNLVLSNENVGEVIDTIKLIHGFKISISIGIINQNTYDSRAVDENLFFTTDAEKQKAYAVLDEIIGLRKQRYNIVEPIAYFEEAKRFIAGGHKWDCGTLRHFFSVDSDGRFQFCAGLQAENISIFDVNRDYYKKYRTQLEQKLKICNSKCFGNCYYDETYYIRHPHSFIKQIFLG